MRSVTKKTVSVITITAAATAAAFALGAAGRTPIVAGSDTHFRGAPIAAGPNTKFHGAPTFLADGSTPDMVYRG
jgi:hypothetical protein